MEKPKILIVEDDPFSVQLLRHNLKSYNAEILPVANNAADALKTAAMTEPDVALLDIYLGGEENGLEIAQALQQQYDIPIIYLTGYSSEEVFEQAKQTDPFGYLLKPFTPKELKVTLDMALYKHSVAKELKQQRALFSATLQSLHEAVVSIDVEGKVKFVNPAAESMLDIQPGEVLTDKVKLRLPTSNQPVELSADIFEQESAPVCKMECANKERWVRVSMSSAPNMKDGYVVVFWDVSTEYENQRTAQTVFKALESITETLLIVDENTDKILFASHALEDLTGWPSNEVVGQTPLFLLGPKSLPHFWNDAKLKLRAQDYAGYETLIYSKEGKARLVRWQFSRMKSEGQGKSGLLICMLQDQTNFRQMEEELRQSQKTEAVGRLAGGVAHDFNNLLSVINSYSDLLTLKLEEDSPLAKYVENIRSAGTRATELVAKLLTFSRRDGAKPCLQDVAQVTDDIQKMLRRVIRENIDIQATVPEKLDVLMADRLHLEQIIMNLCVNARDAISAEGKIELRWSQTSLSADECVAKNLNNKTAQSYLVLEVCDSGCGMKPETVEHIFDPYFTTKGEGKGTGLGLSIVQGIVHEMKGSIEVESSLGNGTTFRLYFPATPREQLLKSATVNVVEPEGGNESIMIVEDEESFVDCLQGVFADHGYDVCYASDPLDALEKAKSLTKPLKLLVTDVMMPNMSGKELASKLKESFSDLKVLFITGYDNPLQLLKDFPYSAVVLQKPFSVVSILSKIREVLETTEEDSKTIKLL